MSTQEKFLENVVQAIQSLKDICGELLTMTQENKKAIQDLREVVESNSCESFDKERK